MVQSQTLTVQTGTQMDQTEARMADPHAPAGGEDEEDELLPALQMWTQNTMAQQPAQELQEAPLLSDASINLPSSLSPQVSTFVSPLSPQHGSAQAAP